MRRATPAVLALLLTGCGSAAAEGEPRDAGPARTAAEREAPAPAPRAATPPDGPLRGLGGRVRTRVRLRASPGGRVVRTLGRRTDLGGPQILAVVARRGRWLGVLHPALPNGRAGWVRADRLELLREPYEVVVDRSERRLSLRRGGRTVDAFPVAVGRPGSPTPAGRFAVTDRLVPEGSSPYGCCVLALSGRQTRLPPGWTGGDRLALHGTTTEVVGGAYSAGCVRIRARDLRRLFGVIPVGTRVTVRD